jgi:small-conductance mechanosensitive channel
VSFSSAFYHQLVDGRTLWVILAWIVVSTLAGLGGSTARLRLAAPTFLVVLHTLCALVVVGTVASGYDPKVAAVAALAFELLGFVGLAQVLVFWIALPRAGFSMPRILVDVVTAIASLVALIAVGKRAGFSVAGLITTSAVLTAVIGFAMQDTLGNLMGGLALQMDSSIKVGDWITLGAGQPTGQVTEIRWRYTAIETRNWETVVLPNSLLMKSPVTVLGRRTGEPVKLRRSIDFHVDFRTPPTEVMAVVRGELSVDPVPHMAREPVPQVLFMAVRDSYAMYQVRYWLDDLTFDDPTDSDVRTRIYFALQRAGISLSIPAQTVFLTADTDARRERKQQEEHRRRLAAIALVDLLEPLGPEERDRLADQLTYTPFAAGEAVTHEGDHDDGLYMLVAGVAAVRIGGDGGGREVARLERGQFFGEMSLMTGEVRSATVVAVTDLECYRLDKTAFEALLHGRPALANQVAELLAARREALASVRDQASEARNRRLATAKQDLLGRIRSFFSLDG